MSLPLPPFKPVAIPCPSCASTDTDCLTTVSKDAHVDYFRCQSCGLVWNTPRDLLEPPCDYEHKA